MSPGEGVTEMILVIGATGDLGGRVTRTLSQQGHAVRCLVRPTSDVSVLQDLEVEVAPGDLTEPESLAAACQGVTTVVATATMIARRLAGAARPTIREADEEGMASLVTAAESAGVQRFVNLSFPGVEKAIGTPLERAKAGHRGTVAWLAAAARHYSLRRISGDPLRSRGALRRGGGEDRNHRSGC